MKMSKVLPLSVFLGVAVLAGCQAGQDINYDRVSMIQRNATSEQQIRALFGEPTETYLSTKRGTKTLIYEYKDNDGIKKFFAGAAGATAGGLLGNLVGNGSGQALATMAGAVAGGAAAGSAVTTREVKKQLTVLISLATGKVIDYDFTSSGSKSAGYRPSTGTGSL